MSGATAAEAALRTRVLCPACGDAHAARLERRCGQAIGRVACPSGERAVPLSSDAELYFRLRARSYAPQTVNGKAAPPPLLGQVAITDHCDVECPICYADSRPQAAPYFLPVDEVLRRAGEARGRGTRTVALSGGEPTLHPDLLTMVRRVRSAGVRVTIVTNGLRLAREPGLAQALKAAGLSKVRLQLDSLREDTHVRQRGNAFVPEKRLAATRVVEAGLRLGTITTVTTLNLGEVGSIVAFALALAPRLSTIVFQAAAPVGRYELGTETLVDKEQILRRLLSGGSLPSASIEDVWPLPHYEPWGMRVHPDCGVNLIGIQGRGGFVPLGRFLDTEALHARLHRAPERRHWAARNLIPLRDVLACARPGRRGELLRGLLGFLWGRGGHGVVVIGVGAFCCDGFIDVQRIQGCATAELTERGPVSPCLLYSGLADRIAAEGIHEATRKEA